MKEVDEYIKKGSPKNSKTVQTFQNADEMFKSLGIYLFSS
jgi:hypothetical protein